jgi:hypothetical protein
LAASPYSGYLDCVTWVYPNGQTDEFIGPELVTPSDWPNGLALTVYINVCPLLADSAAVPQPGVHAQEVDSHAVAALLRQAVDAWAATGLQETQLARLRNVGWQVTDLPGRMLGGASGTTILLDCDAAGYGWFIDPTPPVSEEFVQTSATSFRAPAESPAAGRVDLLTVLTHELGHILGSKDLDLSNSPDNLMAGILGPGQRRVPWSEAVDATLADCAWRG